MYLNLNSVQENISLDIELYNFAGIIIGIILKKYTFAPKEFMLVPLRYLLLPKSAQQHIKGISVSNVHTSIHIKIFLKGTALVRA